MAQRKKKVKIGCSGFPGGKARYFRRFDLVEVNETFYRLPQLATAEKWRETAPPEFEFVVKAFQGVTHPARSPTWRRAGDVPGKRENYGELKWTREVRDSWERTAEICLALRARLCLLQLPRSFRDTPENIRRAEKFFSSIDRHGLLLALELRGWSDENWRRLCEEWDLIAVSDPFSSLPVSFGRAKIAYLRLHGSPPGPKLYSYKYTDQDLRELKKKIQGLRAVREVYVFFNNLSMAEDAERFRRLWPGS